MKAFPLPLLLTALALFSPLVVPGQEEKPPATGASAEEAMPEEIILPREGLVRMEVFTLSRDEARTATRKFPKQADLYAWLGAELEVENPKVKLERLMVLRVRAGQKSKLEEIDEYPVLQVLDPPQIPQTVGIGQPAPVSPSIHVTVPKPTPAPPTPPGSKGEPGPSGAAAAPVPGPPGSSPPGTIFPPWPYATATPHTFVPRNTGWTVEIELTISEDGETVDLNIAPEFVRLCGLESQSPTGEVVQPVFETSTMATQIVTKLGQPTLAGTFSPPADTGVPGGNLEKVTRLLFLTVTDPR